MCELAKLTPGNHKASKYGGLNWMSSLCIKPPASLMGNRKWVSFSALGASKRVYILMFKYNRGQFNYILTMKYTLFYKQCFLYEFNRIDFIGHFTFRKV